MSISRDRLYIFSRIVLHGANLLVVAALLAVAVLIHLERGWARPVFRDAPEAFRFGTIGTELMPLPVALVLPDMFPEHFLPGGKEAGDWVEQFGFLRNSDPKINQGLPVGFAISNYRPQTGAPSPVPFVGFSCALCHSTQISENNQPGEVRYGPGSMSLNLFAWLDAFQSAILEREDLPKGSTFADAPPGYKLNIDSIAKAYQKKTGQKLGLVARGMTALWLRQIRARISSGLSRFDEPYGNGQSRKPEYTPTGPTRTQPFRTLIRSVLDRPGNDMPVYTKIATVFSEDLHKRSQFDGSIGNLYARSSLAALAAGATVTNMALPEIAHNIRKASDFTATLRPPRYDDVFPAAAAGRNAALVARGKVVYEQHCYSCHGWRDASGNWTNGPKTGEVTPVAQIETDAERVMFRHYGELAGRMFDLFPAKHPFHFPRNEIWPQVGQEDDIAARGYVNAPIDGVFLRAPYLHNASVLTLAELINLKERRSVFYRGKNTYDPADVGFRSPNTVDAAGNYFKFDVAVRGNSNKGHDYPWAFKGEGWNSEDLTALLEYLKTL